MVKKIHWKGFREWIFQRYACWSSGRWHLCTQATAFSYDGGSIAGAELGFPVACNWKEKQPLLWTSFDIHLTLIFFWHLGLVKMCNIGSKRKIDVPIDCWGRIHSSVPLPWEQEHNQEEADSWQLGQELLAPKEWGPRNRCRWRWEEHMVIMTSVNVVHLHHCCLAPVLTKTCK